MVYGGVARFVDPESYQLYDWSDWSAFKPEPDEPFLQSVSQRFRIPEVLSLVRFDRLPRSTVTFNRRNIFKRDRFTCQYCGVQPSPDELTIDHVLPRSRGGESTWTNCVLACLKCNHIKADRRPPEARMQLRTAPVRPGWNPTYSRHSLRMESWQKFISDSYWDIELQEN